MTSNYKIPFIVHQTFYTTNLPLEIIKIIQNNKKICPKYKFIFYDDDQCEQFIKTNFDEITYKAYMKLNKEYGAMKADFFRYCVLYKIGGVYLDIKSVILKPLGIIIKPNDICILDIPRNNLETWRKKLPTYEQWILMFTPGHPYLKKMIEQMVTNIEKNYEPQIPGYPFLTSKQKILQLTGPDALTRAINSYISENNNLLHRSINYNNNFMRCNGNYLQMYKNKKHYSQVNKPLYNT
jgi:mannosyltransferase OCH1-like enzyme